MGSGVWAGVASVDTEDVVDDVVVVSVDSVVVGTGIAGG